MVNAIHADAVVQQELVSRGIDAKTGVYGEHKVQLGRNAAGCLPAGCANRRRGIGRVTRPGQGHPLETA